MKLWDIATGQPVWSARIPRPTDKMSPVVFTPDGSKILTAHDVFDARNGEIWRGPAWQFYHGEETGSERTLNAGNGWANEDFADDYDSVAHAAEFSPDGKQLFIRHGGRSWATLRQYQEQVSVGLPGSMSPAEDCYSVKKLWSESDSPYLGRFSADGLSLATANADVTARIWSTVGHHYQELSPLTSPMEHQAMVSDLSFSPDGSRLVTGTTEGDARIWNVTTGKPITPWLPHASRVLRVAFSADGARLLVACEDGSVAVWSMETTGVPRFTWPVDDIATDDDSVIRLSPDGAILATQVAKNSTATAWSLQDGRPLIAPLKADGQVSLIESNLIIRDTDHTHWSVVNLQSGSKATQWTSNLFGVAGNYRIGEPNGIGRLASANRIRSNELLIMDMITGEPTSKLYCPLPIRGSAAVHPNGKVAVGFLTDDRLAVWNVQSPEPSLLLKTKYTWNLHFSPGGRWLIGGWGYNDWMRDGEEFQPLAAGDNDRSFQTISPDETWAVTAESGSWQFQNITNGIIAPPKFKHRGRNGIARFSADSGMVITSGSDSVLRYWKVPTAEPAAIPMSLPSATTEILVTGDGRGFVTVHGDDTVRFWELPKGKRPVSDWLALARFFANGRGEHGRSADFQSAVSPTSSRQSAASTSTPEATTNAPVRSTPGGLETRDTADWKSALQGQSFHAQWLALRAQHPEVFTVSANEIDAWHRHEAWRCESRQDWSNAVTHLSALLETHPDSGDFLPRRAAAHVAWASDLVAAEVTRLTHSAASTPPVGRANEKDQSLLPSAATTHWERALTDYARTLAWVDRFPAIAKESRKPFVEKRREVYLKLGRKSEAEADERELKAAGR